MTNLSFTKANTSQISINAEEIGDLNDTIVSTPPVGTFGIHNDRQIQEIREIARSEVAKAIFRFTEALSATIQLKIDNPDPTHEVHGGEFYSGQWLLRRLWQYFGFANGTAGAWPINGQTASIISHSSTLFSYKKPGSDPINSSL